MTGTNNPDMDIDEVIREVVEASLSGEITDEELRAIINADLSDAEVSALAELDEPLIDLKRFSPPTISQANVNKATSRLLEIAQQRQAELDSAQPLQDELN